MNYIIGSILWTIVGILIGVLLEALLISLAVYTDENEETLSMMKECGKYVYTVICIIADKFGK
jgi:hypothetical protein